MFHYYSKSSCFSSIKLCTLALLSALASTGVLAKSDTNNHYADTPIRIAKGQVSTTITGTLSPKQNDRWYQFSAASWQYVIINIAPLAGTSETANVGELQMPNGTQEGNKGGIIYQGCLPATGKYRLRIARNLMATQGKTAGYTVEVVILPKYASEDLCEYL